MKIDPNKTWAKVEERLAGETDPVLRRNLEVANEFSKRDNCCGAVGTVLIWA